jgi:hypothetical protein
MCEWCMYFIHYLLFGWDISVVTGTENLKVWSDNGDWNQESTLLNTPENVDIEIGVHDAFLELHSSDTLKVERLK